MICAFLLVSGYFIVTNFWPDEEEDELERLLGEMDVLETEFRELYDEQFELELELEELNEELEELKEDHPPETRLPEIEDKIEELRSDIKDLEDKIIALTEMLEDLRKKILELEDRITALLNKDAEDDDDDDYVPPTYESGTLSIHFLELGNKYTGDCIYIKNGNVEVIVDAGSRTTSAKTIVDYVGKHNDDGIIEYVIATHAHQDHIAGFYSTGTGANRVLGVLDAFDIGTIIDYPMTNSTTVTKKNYEDTRDRLVETTDTVHFTALECYKESKTGAQRIYDLGDGVELEILYNYYYENKSSSENNYSVCFRILNNGQQYLFTGDLEEAGEKRLVDYYEKKEGGLGKCVLYKAGHHGSTTSSGTDLLGAIQPDYIIITTCAGTAEYSSSNLSQFPTQIFISRIVPYTTNVYVTTIIHDYSGNKFGSMNGNIIFAVTAGEISIECSNNDTILKDTDWFKTNRTWA